MAAKSGASASKSKGGWKGARATGKRAMNATKPMVFGILGILLFLVPLVNWIWIQTGNTSDFFVSYCYDAQNNPTACVLYEGTSIERSYTLYYFDVWNYLGHVVRPFNVIWESVVDTFSSFGEAMPDGDVVSDFFNCIILVLHVLWSVLKFFLFLPLTLIAAIFQAFMSSWVADDGWLILCLRFRFPYIGNDPVSVIFDYLFNPWAYI